LKAETEAPEGLVLRSAPRFAGSTPCSPFTASPRWNRGSSIPRLGRGSLPRFFWS
jgi:hypothetical protein